MRPHHNAPGIDVPPSRSVRRVRGVLVAAGIVALMAGAIAPPAAAQAAESEGLVVTYPEETLRLNDLAPGESRSGDALVTNYNEDPVAVNLSADWSEPPLSAAGVDLEARLCAEWTGEECAGEFETLPLSSASIGVGTLGAGETWLVRFSATMDPEAGNETQNLSEDFTLQLIAQAQDPDSDQPDDPVDQDDPSEGQTDAGGEYQPEGPGDEASEAAPASGDDLAETGSTVWPLVGLAAALLLIGGLLTRFAVTRHRQSGNH